MKHLVIRRQPSERQVYQSVEDYIAQLQRATRKMRAARRWRMVQRFARRWLA